MGIEQTGFLHIFKPKNSSDSSNSPVEMVDDKELEPVREDKASKKPEYLISESLIVKEEEVKKEAEIKLKRLQLLQASREIALSEFEDIMPEIKAYGIRLSMLRAAHEDAASGEEKQKAYMRLVNPDMYDDEAHRDSACLYLKYLEAVKTDKKQQVFLNRKISRKKRVDANSFDYRVRKLKNYKPGYKDASARNFE